ncbi:DNA methyltransferase [uncultured Chryseobacterium sp.]|uniref:DNA methyltransferase n=1 Tax=uncultured Chryseobacterium sp. TaxID=259322 RepID=UPI0025839AE9|nr:DNA methyltransferase [uncultured Chryseobacterium sp.]
MKITEKITVTNEDNMELMSRYPDGYFDLAIVDPPYGINAGNAFSGEKRKSGNGCANKSAFDKKDWDLELPDLNYYRDLFRVSKNQIIWGANYMTEFLPNSMGWIVWDKNNGTTKFSDCELAFSSFEIALRKFTYTWNGMLQGDMKNKEERIHPTQKPVALYKWLLDKYAKPGDKIIDTHLGSGSIAIACHDYGFELTACELDTDYYNASIERIKRHVAFNQSLFSPEQLNQQNTLFT